MRLNVGRSGIRFKNDDVSFTIFKTMDNDIWFGTDEDKMTFIFDSYSRNREEWQSYEAFSKLMRNIIGSYFLEDDNKNGMLPADFINIEDKIITWHSDSESNNILEIMRDGRYIAVTISKDIKTRGSNNVRIRTDGSSYGNYYQYFTELYRDVLKLGENTFHLSARENLEEQPAVLQKKR